jgi:hypothetical protein
MLGKRKFDEIHGIIVQNPAKAATNAEQAVTESEKDHFATLIDLLRRRCAGMSIE